MGGGPWDSLSLAVSCRHFRTQLGNIFSANVIVKLVQENSQAQSAPRTPQFIRKLQIFSSLAAATTRGFPFTGLEAAPISGPV